eukprot:NODE_873_length_1140_cov_109.052320_g831_i0.p1 GENE.NODE_873_length_1140_cov_109.052320_g831_i0~~NODE_873_length_1140_cov_109.052320_g831_i0.p1  ORF type:complete len:331 (+),score=55.30 NODE_873_length_1140_cov_109.052320_g831_i0:76-1068(+)
MIKPFALHGHTRSVTRVKFNFDSDLLFSTAKDLSPTVWSSETGIRLGTYEGHTGAVWDCDVNFSSTMLATAGGDGLAKLWDLRTGQEIASIDHGCPVRSVGFSHGDTMLFTVTDKSFGNNPAISIYNLPGGTPGAVSENKATYNAFLRHEAYEKITCALWGPTNDTIYFSSDDGSIVVFNLEKQTEEAWTTAHRGEVKRFSFDTDYCTFVSGSVDQTAKLFDAKTLTCLKTYENDKQVNDVAIHPQKNQVLLAGGYDAQSITNLSHKANKFETRFFHKVFCEELASVAGHFGPVNAISLSRDGRCFASGGEDGFVRLHHFDEKFLKAPDS